MFFVHMCFLLFSGASAVLVVVVCGDNDCCAGRSTAKAAAGVELD